MPTEANLGVANANTPRQPHHIEINEAIHSLKGVIHDLKRLRDKIVGEDSADEEKDEKISSPPLSQVLLLGHETIQLYREHCMSLIAEIEEILF